MFAVDIDDVGGGRRTVWWCSRWSPVTLAATEAEAADEETGEEDFGFGRDEKEGKGLPLSVGVGGDGNGRR